MIEGMQSFSSAILMGNHVPYTIIDACNCPSKGCQYAVVLDEIDIRDRIVHCLRWITELGHVVQALTSALLGNIDAVRVVDEVMAITDLQKPMGKICLSWTRSHILTEIECGEIVPE
jgi:hypothetical protein